MNVLIVDKETNMLLFTIPVNIAKRVGVKKDGPTPEEYFEEAWKCAVEDGDVDRNTKEQHYFSLMREE